MTLPAAGTISLSNYSTELGQSATYSSSLSWIQTNTKVALRPTRPNIAQGYGYAYYQRNVDSNCSNDNCTANCNCGNLQCVNCAITGTVNCANCDVQSWLQPNCNCACTYNCTSSQITYNCACACACACACGDGGGDGDGG